MKFELSCCSRHSSISGGGLGDDFRRKTQKIAPDKIKNPPTIPATIAPIAPPVRLVEGGITVTVGGMVELDCPEAVVIEILEVNVLEKLYVEDEEAFRL